MVTNRFHAFAIHLGASALIFLVLLYFIVFVWYPPPYFAADGGRQGVLLIVGVDLVLGPLLTLIVYNVKKPELKRDLAIIVALQLTALVWGTSVVYEQRTAMVVYVEGAFHALNTAQVQKAGGMALAVAAQSHETPAYAFLRLPANDVDRLALKIQMLDQPLYSLGDRYEPLGPANLSEVVENSLDMAEAAASSAEIRAHVEHFLAGQEGALGDYAFVPTFCRYGRIVLILRRSDGRVIDALDIDATDLGTGDAPPTPGTNSPGRPRPA